MTSLDYFKKLSIHEQGVCLFNAPKRKLEIIIKKIPDINLVQAISFLDPDQATDVLQKINSKHRREKIMTELNKDLQEKINFLFRFNPNTAGGIMDVNYIVVDKKETRTAITKRLKQYEKRTGKIPTIIVADDTQIHGEIPHHTILLQKDISRHIQKLATIHHEEKTNTIVKILKKFPYKKAIVVDEHDNILGIIYSEDLIHILEKQHATSLYDFAGVHDEEDVFDPVMSKVRHRYRWLVINLFTAYIAAYVVSLFAETLSTFVLLAAYMPIVAGMGGNAGTQTLAVMVRSIALGEIELKNSFHALIHEVTAGFINGIITGSVVALIAMLWNHSTLLGLITGTAIVINLVVAGFFGAIIPLIMKKLGKDPATSATIFITTATDVFGFFTFLGLATLLLK